MRAAHRVVFLDRQSLTARMRRPACAESYVGHDQTTAADEVVARLAGATVAISNNVPLRAETLSQLPALKRIAVAATGYDVIDLAHCREHGIAVANIRHYAVHTVPEHALALILALNRWYSDSMPTSAPALIFLSTRPPQAEASLARNHGKRGSHAVSRQCGSLCGQLTADLSRHGIGVDDLGGQHTLPLIAVGRLGGLDRVFPLDPLPRPAWNGRLLVSCLPAAPRNGFASPFMTMNIPLTKDLEDLIRRKVESRDYLSAAHLIEEALSLLEERDQVAVVRRARLVQRLAYSVSQANSRQLIGMAEVFDGLTRKSNALE